MKRSNKKVAQSRVAAAALDMKSARVKAKPAAPAAEVRPTELSSIDAPASVEETEASLTEALTQARQRNDFAEMCDRTEMLRRRLPDSELGFRFGSIALREANRLDDAAALLAAAPPRFAERYWLLAEHVVLAQKRQDWQDTATRAGRLRERFPTGLFGWQAGCDALQKLGDLAAAERLLEEADCVLGEANANYPGKEWLLTTATWLAVRRDAWQQAGERATLLREAFPANEHGWSIGLRSLRLTKKYAELEALLKQGETAQPGKAFLLTEAAALLQAQGDFDEASRQWQRARETRPDLQDGYVGGIQVNNALGRLDESEAIMQDLLARLPTFRWALVEAAQLAQQRLDYAEADRRWAKAASLFPEDRVIRLKHAIVHSLHPVNAKRDWPTTLQRLQSLHDDFPDYAEGWRAHIYALRSQGVGREAEQLAETCIQKMPNEPDLWIQYAHSAADHGDLERATARLKDAANRFPDNAEVQAAFAQALSRSNRLDEADWQYQQGCARFPNSADLACGYAANAAKLQDWPEALRRWTVARERFPSDVRPAQGVLEIYSASEEGAVISPSFAKIDSMAPVKQLGRDQTYRHFESLGGTGQGCEFGIVQLVAGGAEPLGLLRWSHIPSANLAEALENRFDGVGSPEQTLIDFYPTADPANPEYRSIDTRYEFGMHTHVYKKDLSKEKMFAQTCLRMKFLRRKLIQDLEDGVKIFVHKIFERNLTDEELGRLYRAVRSYGDNSLLYVRYEDQEHPSGSVVQADDGLFIGYISGFSMTFPTGRLQRIDLPAWSSICKTVLSLHLAQGRLTRLA